MFTFTYALIIALGVLVAAMLIRIIPELIYTLSDFFYASPKWFLFVIFLLIAFAGSMYELRDVIMRNDDLDVVFSPNLFIF